MLDSRKRSVLMVCAHEPSLDPRIRWESQYASAEFDVTVLGFAGDENAIACGEKGADVCKTVRLKGSGTSSAAFFWYWLAVLPIQFSVVGALLLVILLPLLALLEVGIRATRAALRAVSSPNGGGGPVATPEAVLKVRGRLLARIAYIVAILRIRFAPATVLFWIYITQHRLRPDVVHCNDLDTLLVGVLAKQRLGSRLVYDAHEFFPVSDVHGRWIDIAFFKLIERTLIDKADAVFTVNPMLAEAMRQTYGLRAVHSLPNAEPWNGMQPAAGELLTSSLAGNRVKFLFQGRFSPERGIEELIKGWADVDGSKSVLFLRGPDNVWRQKALKLAEDLGLLNTTVYFLDPVREDMLVSAAAEADVGLIPYKPISDQ